MKNDTKSVELTSQELGVIQSALQTQEKILSLQSRAGVDTTARARLSELKSVLRRLSRHTPAPKQQAGRICVARSLFG